MLDDSPVRIAELSMMRTSLAGAADTPSSVSRPDGLDSDVRVSLRVGFETSHERALMCRVPSTHAAFWRGLAGSHRRSRFLALLCPLHHAGRGILVAVRNDLTAPGHCHRSVLARPP